MSIEPFLRTLYTTPFRIGDLTDLVGPAAGYVIDLKESFITGGEVERKRVKLSKTTIIDYRNDFCYSCLVQYILRLGIKDVYICLYICKYM